MTTRLFLSLGAVGFVLMRRVSGPPLRVLRGVLLKRTVIAPRGFFSVLTPYALSQGFILHAESLSR